VTTTLRQPFAVRAINRAGGVVERLGVRASLDAQSLLDAASTRTGLTDFGAGTFREGLDVLTRSLDDEARLTTIGRVAARQRLIGLLELRLRLVDHRTRNPEIAKQSIERPIFVLGLPRTGTTVLYGMLAANPAMRAPASWEVSRPFPPATGDDDGDPRIAQADKELGQFRRLAPGADAIHPMDARLPQECIALQAPEFASYEFPCTFPVPSYWTWLRHHDLHPAYEFERQFLQHLQSGHSGAHWVLKTPAHLMWLDTLLDVFPDALLVHTHRNPTSVLASVSSLMSTFRSAMSSAVDKREVGREQLDAWTWALERTMAVRDRLPDDRVVDVHFRNTVGDPVGTVRRVYEHLGLALTPAVEDGVRTYLAANPRDKHGTHTYTLEEFGLDRDEVDAAFARYNERFGVGAD
jgi:soluble cytochrome b562